MFKRGGGKFKHANEPLVNICGRYTAVYEPQQIENFSGWAKVVIGDRVVKGPFPFLDENFEYNFQCYLTQTYRGPEFEIHCAGSPPFTPLPLTRSRFKLMLQRVLGFHDHMADELISKLVRDERVADIDFEDNIDPKKLLTALAPTPDWLDQLAQRSVYFRYPFIKILHSFWNANELSSFTIPQLLKIASEFDSEPEMFAYEWLNEFHLPELSFDKVQLAYRLLNRPEPRNLRSRMIFYQSARAESTRFGHPCVTQEECSRWGVPVEPCVAAKIIRPAAVFTASNVREMYYFTFPRWQNLQFIIENLRRLNSLPLKTELFLKKPRKINFSHDQLNDKQKQLVELSRKHGFMIWDAVGGTGKTTTAQVSAALSKKKNVLPVAYFGRVASNLRKSWGHGITIHRLYHLIKSGTEQGEFYKKHVKRVYWDEGSHGTFELFGMLFDVLPELEQLIVMGDWAQMRPPSGVPIYESLLEFYAGTPVVQTLSEVMRVDRSNANNANVLIENAMKLREGRSDLVYSRELTPDAPFVVLPRLDIPPDLYLLNANKPEVRQKRVEIIKQTLRPLINHLQHFQNFQMITLRHDTINDMNMALSQLWQESPANGFQQERMYKIGSKITFSQNYYPHREMELPSDATKRAQMLASVEYRTRTTQINNNEICMVTELVDIDPVSGVETPIRDTSVDRASPSLQRIIRLDSGGQLNLADIPLSKIFRGDVSTASSAQGGEWDIVGYYTDQRDVEVKNERLGPLMKQDVMYTVASRAKKQVIIMCRAVHDNLEHSDIGTVARAKRPAPDLILHKWLPPYQPPVQPGGSDVQVTRVPDPEATDADDVASGSDEI